MKNAMKDAEQGFTLLEVIVTLLLIGIISMFAGDAIISAVHGFSQARDNVETAQKVHLAVNRISRDLQVANNIVSGTSQVLVFDTILPSGLAVTETLASANGTVTLNGRPLLDEVAGFAISYVRYNSGTEVVETSYTPGSSRGVEIQIQRGQGAVQYVDRIFPRNIPQNRGMLQ